MKNLDDLINAAKIQELIKREDPQEKATRRILWVFAVIGAITAVAGIRIIWMILMMISMMTLMMISLKKRKRLSLQKHQRHLQRKLSIRIHGI